MRTLAQILCFFALFVLPAFTDEPLPAKIVFFTIPKGGSQLCRKVISLLTERPLRKLPYPLESPLPNFLEQENPCIGYHHLDEDFPLIREDYSSRFIKVIMLRDPRDVLVSMAAWIQVMADTDAARLFADLPLEEQISQLIIGPDLSMNGSYPFVFDTYKACLHALLWMQDPSVFVCRFEDLVGPEGGGSLETQRATVSKLAKHLCLHLTQEKIYQVADALFGDTATFRSGQIGSWKEVFTDQHKTLFKEKMGKELILLGYEQDDSW
ncbi:MAG: hypothetical protein FJZ58_03630 [Chlamydiae bacterium]|nr:hypothetical protein [Chlamydiota bacterium]